MASRSLNKVLLIGHLGKDAETKFTSSGVSYSRFSVATNRRWKDQKTDEWKEETDWTNVVVWRKENLAKYLTKGTQVYIEGRLQSRSFDGKDGKVYITEVIADDIFLLGGRGDEQSSNARAQQPASRRAGNGNGAGYASGSATAVEEDPFDGMGITDDDVPFK